MMKPALAVIFGGISVEHEVSILTFLSVYPFIDATKWTIIPIYYSKNNQFYISEQLTNKEIYENLDISKLKEIQFIHRNNQTYLTTKNIFRKIPIHAILPLVHGTSGEDGTLQGMFEVYKIPYAQTTASSCIIGHDKQIMKSLLNQIQIPQTAWISINRDELVENIKILDDISIELPWIIKPANTGSSIGITLVEKEEEKAIKALESCSFDHKIIIEKKLDNFREFNLALIQNRNEIIYSHVEEVIKSDKILSYQDKYGGSVVKSVAPKRIFPAQCEETWIQKMKEYSSQVYRELNLSGIVRFDFLVHEDQVYLNECNLIPGSLSLYLFDGIMNRHDLLEIILNEMIETYKKNQRIIRTIESPLLKEKLVNRILMKNQ